MTGTSKSIAKAQRSVNALSRAAPKSFGCEGQEFVASDVRVPQWSKAHGRVEFHAYSRAVRDVVLEGFENAWSLVNDAPRIKR